MNKSYSRQKGSTLVVVLILVLIIMIICTVAVKKSMSSLALATSEQAQQLMFQSSEAYFINLNKTDNQEFSASVFGLVGYVTQSENKGHEIAFCYDNKMSGIFDINKIAKNSNVVASVIDNLKPTKQLNSKGYCSNKQYTSARNAVVTQVYVKSIDGVTKKFQNYKEKTDSSLVLEPVPIRIFVISVIPALSANPEKIQVCFSNFPAEKITDIDTDTVTDCLKRYNIPYSAQTADYQQFNELS